MKNDYASCEARILVYEGGKVDNPRDPGGRTNRGITQNTFNAYMRSISQPTRDVYTITPGEVSTIYQIHYWDVIAGDQLPAGLDLVVFDAAVNSGPGQAGKWLQAALGDHYVGVRDGAVGARTLQAVEDYVGSDDTALETLINAVCARRLATLRSLRTWATFGRGWSARIANVQKAGDRMSAGTAAASAVDVTGLGGHQKAKIADQKTSPISAVTTHTTVIASSAAGVATHAATQLTPVQESFPQLKWLAYVIGGFTAVAAVAGIIIELISSARTAASAGTATATVDLDADAGLPETPVTSIASK